MVTRDERNLNSSFSKVSNVDRSFQRQRGNDEGTAIFDTHFATRFIEVTRTAPKNTLFLFLKSLLELSTRAPVKVD